MFYVLHLRSLFTFYVLSRHVTWYLQRKFSTKSRQASQSIHISLHISLPIRLSIHCLRPEASIGSKQSLSHLTNPTLLYAQAIYQTWMNLTHDAAFCSSLSVKTIPYFRQFDYAYHVNSFTNTSVSKSCDEVRLRESCTKQSARKVLASDEAVAGSLYSGCGLVAIR